MKLINKLRKADHAKKSVIWHKADLTRDEALLLVREMILSIPGHYKLHSREYGTNLVDTIYEVYGWIPSLFIDEPMLLGLAVLYPNKVYASFTLGLDAIEIKK